MHPRLVEIDAFLADKREEVLVAVRSLPDPAPIPCRTEGGRRRRSSIISGWSRRGSRSSCT